MKTLQLWFSEDSSTVKPYMESVIKHTPNIEHYFVGPTSASVEGQIVLDYQTEIDKAYELLGNNDWWNTYCTENMFKAEMIRLSWAIQHQDLLYVDADVEFLSAPISSVLSDIPIMGRNAGLQEFFLFYVNGNSKWFQELIEYTTSKPIEKYAFMNTFVEIRREKCLSKPILWRENTFYKRHR